MFTAEWYQFAKAIHLISVMSFMAGMLYLPRLYVYHVNAKKKGELDETLKIMERKLLRFIINPALIIMTLSGLWLIKIQGFGNIGIWFHIKIMLLIFMFLTHGMFARWRKKFAKNENIHSEKFFRIINEVPTLLMIIIVFLAVLKPM